MRGRPGLIEVREDGAVIVEPVAVSMLLTMARALGRERHANGLASPALAVELADWFKLAAGLVVEHSYAPIGSASGTTFAMQQVIPSPSVGQDLVDLEEASAMLGPSDAYLRRLCREGKFVTARKVGGAWLIDRAELVARATGQNQEKAG